MTTLVDQVSLTPAGELKKPSPRLGLGRLLAVVACCGPLPLIGCAVVFWFSVPGVFVGAHGEFDDNAVAASMLALIALPFAVLALPVATLSGVAVLVFGQDWGLGTPLRVASAASAAVTFAGSFLAISRFLS